MYLKTVLLSILITSCAGERQNCAFYERGSSEYRLCRADEGSKEYQFRVGVEHYVNNEYEIARKWLSLAAKNNIRITSTEILPSAGTMTGRFIRDEREITEQGIEAASFMLAKFYREGVGVKVNEDRARDYQNAAGRWLVEIEEKNIQYVIHVKSSSLFAANDTYHELYSFNITKQK